MFLFLFLFLFLFVDCRSETSFTGQVTQGHRSFGLEEGARRARRRRIRWRQAMASLSRDAMPSTEGSAQPSTTLEVSSSHPRVSSFGHSRSPRFLVSESRWSPLRCGHRRATERLGLYQTQPLNLPLRCPAPTMNQQFLGRFEDLGLVSPRALSSL